MVRLFSEVIPRSMFYLVVGIDFVEHDKYWLGGLFHTEHGGVPFKHSQMYFE